jgi:hypothetical protein
VGQDKHSALLNVLVQSYDVDMPVITLVAAIWLAAITAGWLSRRTARRESAWLRSNVSNRVAYARLRAEIEREHDAADPTSSS